MRSNVPAEERWYSRDVSAIAEARGLQTVAPYFHRRRRYEKSRRLAVGGLTQIVFHNSHLVYAITWYGLAAMTLGLAVFLVYFERQRAKAVR
jgi:surfeit locus 1 family protein